MSQKTYNKSKHDHSKCSPEIKEIEKLINQGVKQHQAANGVGASNKTKKQK